MPQASINCPACNKQIETKPGRTNRFCPNCGKPVTLFQPQINTPSPESLLEKACILMNQGNFPEAEPFIEEALVISPEYADGYIVRLLCMLHLKSINDLGTIDTPLTSYEDFQAAIRYGSTYQLKRFEKLMEKNAEMVEKKKQKQKSDNTQRTITLHKETEDLRRKICDAEKFFSAVQNRPPLPRWRKILRTVELTFMICSVSFWTLGVLFVPQLIIIDAPFILRLIFIILRNQKEKRLPGKVQEMTRSLNANKVLLQEKTEFLSDFSKPQTRT